jgi:hypothetical protein
MGATLLATRDVIISSCHIASLYDHIKFVSSCDIALPRPIDGADGAAASRWLEGGQQLRRLKRNLTSAAALFC